MNKQTRKRLSYLVFFLLLVWAAIEIKTQILPIFSHPLVSHQQSPMSLVINYAPLFVLCLTLVALSSPRKQTSDAHGTSHFATNEELKTYGTLVSTPRKEQKAISKALTVGTPPPSKMHLGFYHKKLIVLDEQMQESHVLLLAPTGVGKTSRIIVPALLREYGSRSLFINDTKGELVELTIGHLAQYHQCFVFAPTQPRTSHHYNPLTHVHDMNDAEALANCLIDNTGKSREEFWNSAPKLLVASTVLHLRTAEPNAPFSRLIDLLCGTTVEHLKNCFAAAHHPWSKK